MNSDEIARIVESVVREVGETPSEVEYLREELNQVSQQFAALKAEDQGWLSLFGGDSDREEGLSLKQVKEVSQRLRESVAGSPLPKQADALRFSYTFSAPFIIPGLTGSIEVSPGRKPKLPRLNEFYEADVNQRYVFGNEAQELISRACSTDGVYLALGDDKKRTLRPIPVREVAAVTVNDDFPGEVWAYLREWSHTKPNGEQETLRAWIYTDRFEGTREASLPGLTENGRNVPVDKDKTIIDFSVNQQVGWTFGVPDLMPGEAWNRKYITMMSHGEDVSSAMAYFALQIKKSSNKGAQNTGVKMANGPRGAGNTALVGEGNEIGALTASKSAYDFDGLRPIASMYASSTSVSVVDLLASPGAAGSSYGSASALLPGMRRGIESRRKQVAAWLERVIKWGTGERIKVTPASIEEVDPYRRIQMVSMLNNSGLAHADEARPEMMYLAGVTPKHSSEPEGYLLPNNEDSIERSDIDTDGMAPTGTTSPTAGIDTGAGSGGDSATSNDLRDDGIQ